MTTRGSNQYTISIHNISSSETIRADVGESLDKNIARDFYRLQILYDEILYYMNSKIELYNNGVFEDFVHEFTEDKLLEINSLINDDDRFYNYTIAELKDFIYNNITFSNYRSIATNMTNTIQQAITEYYKYKTIESENIELKSYKEILENREKLINYLNTIQRTTFLFSAEATYTNNLQIKLWYRLYLERHGPPGDGVFNAELLSSIIEELIEEGLINEDDIIT